MPNAPDRSPSDRSPSDRSPSDRSPPDRARASVAAASAAAATGALALVAALVSAVSWGARPGADPAPPVYSTVAPFSLSAHTGRPFGSEDLRGQVWIANFIFTRCPTVCPALSARMAEVQARTAALERVHLVSFSVDPEFDAPPVLAAHADRLGAGPRWTFLTGPFDAIRAAVHDGLRVSVGRAEADGPIDPAQVLHGTHFVLVDAQGQIRGYHDVADEQGLRALVAAARRLAAAPPPSPPGP